MYFYSLARARYKEHLPTVAELTFVTLFYSYLLSEQVVVVLNPFQCNVFLNTLENARKNMKTSESVFHIKTTIYAEINWMLLTANAFVAGGNKSSYMHMHE